MNTSGRPLVEARALTRVYRLGGAEVRALDGVDLVVPAGEFLSVMGRSGSGKSTLLNVLGCLDRPTSGSVWIDGLDVTTVPRRRLPEIRRQKIGFIFQQYNLIPTLTAIENVMLPLRYAGVVGVERDRRGREALELVGLLDRRHHRPAEMSGGEQQRVAIARSLVNRPAIILADEPTGEVDTQTSARIVALMRKLNQEDGQTFTIVTHDPAVAAATDRILFFRDGAIEREEIPRGA